MKPPNTACKETIESANGDNKKAGPAASRRETVAVTGAAGCPDNQLPAILTGHYDVIALSCEKQKALDQRRDKVQAHSHVQWRPCDLFSLPSAEKALEGADYAIYFLHRPQRPARLTQADTADMNAIQADYFARAALKNGIKHILLLLNTVSADNLNSQLQSSLETERILASYGLPFTTLGTRQQAGTVHDSRPVPAELADAGRALLMAAAGVALSGKQAGAPAKSSAAKTGPFPDVRSIQRVVLPGDTDAAWAARYYTDWLGSLLKPLIRIDYHDSEDRYRLCLRAFSRPILELTCLPLQSSPQHTVFRISGGILTKQRDPYEGRLAFLQISGSCECIIAIHDYQPSLPWLLYKHTQARVHLLVMSAFRRHLRRINSRR